MTNLATKFRLFNLMLDFLGSISWLPRWLTIYKSWVIWTNFFRCFNRYEGGVDVGGICFDILVKQKGPCLIGFGLKI